jgi:hypothetical protein
MARGPLTFKQLDVTRALKAARAAGENVHKVEIDRDGKIVLTIGKPEAHPGGREIYL